MEELCWACPGCSFIEFSLEDENVKLIKKTPRTALIEVEGRVHSLKAMTWDKLVLCRRLTDENWVSNVHNIYTKPKRQREHDRLCEEQEAQREAQNNKGKV